MEVIAEIILGFIVEVLIPAVAEIAFELLVRCLGEPFMERESPSWWDW